MIFALYVAPSIMSATNAVFYAKTRLSINLAAAIICGLSAISVSVEMSS